MERNSMDRSYWKRSSEEEREAMSEAELGFEECLAYLHDENMVDQVGFGQGNPKFFLLWGLLMGLHEKRGVSDPSVLVSALHDCLNEPDIKIDSGVTYQIGKFAAEFCEMGSFTPSRNGAFTERV